MLLMKNWDHKNELTCPQKFITLKIFVFISVQLLNTRYTVDNKK